jgi:hypothetical protein
VTLFFATFLVTFFATFSPTTIVLSPRSRRVDRATSGSHLLSWQERPLNASSNLATSNDGCHERLLCNKHSQHAILAQTVCLLQSQQKQSDGNAMLQQRNNPRKAYFIKVLCNQIEISCCQHEHKTSKKFEYTSQ